LAEVKYYFFIAVLSFISLFFSCSQTEKNLCENSISLIVSNDSLPQADLDFDLTNSDLEEKIRKLTAAQDSRKPQRFGLLINGLALNSSIHAKHANLTACYGMPAMMHRSPQLDVFITGDGKALMEGRDLIPLDSITGYIHWYFPHDNPYGEKIVKVNKSKLTPLSVFENGVEHIVNGYLKYYEKRAEELFQKPVCELDSTQLSAVKKSYPFELRLWIGEPSVFN